MDAEKCGRRLVGWETKIMEIKIPLFFGMSLMFSWKFVRHCLWFEFFFLSIYSLWLFLLPLSVSHFFIFSLELQNSFSRFHRSAKSSFLTQFEIPHLRFLRLHHNRRPIFSSTRSWIGSRRFLKWPSFRIKISLILIIAITIPLVVIVSRTLPQKKISLTFSWRPIQNCCTFSGVMSKFKEKKKQAKEEETETKEARMIVSLPFLLRVVLCRFLSSLLLSPLTLFLFHFFFFSLLYLKHVESDAFPSAHFRCFFVHGIAAFASGTV